MNCLQYYSVAIVVACFLIADNVLCTRKNKNITLTASEEVFASNEKRVPPLIPLFVGLGSLSMGTTNRVFGALGSAESATRHRQLKQGLASIKDELSILMEGLRSHVTFMAKNRDMNNVINACQRFDDLREEIEDLQAEADGDKVTPEMEDLAKRILTGKREDGAEIDKLKDGVKEVLLEFYDLFFGPDLGFPKGSIFLLFGKSLDPRSPEFVTNVIRYFGEAIIAQEFCMKAWRKASEILPNMTLFIIDESEIEAIKVKQQKKINSIFSDPIMGPCSWKPASEFNLPTVENVYKGSSNKMLCRVKKTSNVIHVGIVDRNNKCLYAIPSTEKVEESETFEVLYNRCPSYPISFSGSKGEPILINEREKICRAEGRHSRSVPRRVKHESFGIVHGPWCPVGNEHKVKTPTLPFAKWKHHFNAIQSSQVVKSTCNIAEMFNTEYSDLGYTLPSIE